MNPGWITTLVADGVVLTVADRAAVGGARTLKYMKLKSTDTSLLALVAYIPANVFVLDRGSMVLSSKEKIDLGRGVDPIMIQPDSLIFLPTCASM